MEIHNHIKIILADDHEFYLDGLKAFFGSSDLYQVVATASDGRELVNKGLEYKPHIVLTDLRMPLMGGAEAIRTLKAADPFLKCIVLTNYENELAIIEALEAGANGYMTKNMPKKELFHALDQVCAGYPYYCLMTNSKMVRMIGQSKFNPYVALQVPEFTATERKIIHLICEEKDNKQIAKELFMSIRTVEHTRTRIFKKMNVHTTGGLAIYAVKNGLYKIPD